MVGPVRSLLRAAPLLFCALTASAIPLIGTNSTVSANTTISTPVAADTTAPIVAPASPIKTPVGGEDGGYYHSPAFLPNGKHALIPSLSQNTTNGASTWGTLDGPKFKPDFLNTPGQPLPNGKPWGTITANNTNYYTTVPDTGVTRMYDFTISAGTIAPDGVERAAILINGGFPGPAIEANFGDWIQVTVTNNLADEGTSLHWHGMLQTETPYYDGVPGIQQCPLAPGATFTYRFRASLYGTSWYHSHYSAQYASGVIGPMIIYGPKNAEYDIDLGPILLTDYYHQDYFTLVEQTMAPASEGLPPPISNNNLINGKMNYPCANTTEACTPNAGISKFTFQSGKKHRLRLINAGAEGMQKFSIDGYQMTVIANDFVPIVPYTTDLITLGIGQRTDIIVEATGSSTDAVWMRSNLTACALTDGVSPAAVAAIYYENANTSALPTTMPSADITDARLNFCGNDDLSLTVPYYPIDAEETTDVTQDVVITFVTNSTGYNVWEMNNQSFRVDYNDPTLLEAKLGNLDFPAERNVYDFGNATSIRLVVYNTFAFSSHPMHLHGHNMFIVAEGFGTWDGTVKTSNPQRRDVQLVQPAISVTEPSYFVLQFDTDNPGVWPFHCHIAWHVSAGLYINVLERPGDISESSIPSVMAQTCRDWAAFTGDHVVDQIDSGL